jgi:hypothetical protein
MISTGERQTPTEIYLFVFLKLLTPYFIKGTTFVFPILCRCADWMCTNLLQVDVFPPLLLTSAVGTLQKTIWKWTETKTRSRTTESFVGVKPAEFLRNSNKEFTSRLEITPKPGNYLRRLPLRQYGTFICRVCYRFIVLKIEVIIERISDSTKQFVDVLLLYTERTNFKLPQCVYLSRPMAFVKSSVTSEPIIEPSNSALGLSAFIYSHRKIKDFLCADPPSKGPYQMRNWLNTVQI